MVMYCGDVTDVFRVRLVPMCNFVLDWRAHFTLTRIHRHTRLYLVAMLHQKVLSSERKQCITSSLTADCTCSWLPADTGVEYQFLMDLMNIW